MDINKRPAPVTASAIFWYEAESGQICPAVPVACAKQLEQHRDECIEKLRYVASQLIEAGLDDGASPIEQMARRAVADSKQLVILKAERDMWKANHDNQRNLRRMLMDRPDLKERAALIVKLIAERDAALASAAVIQPIRLCCGKSHSGPACPDGMVMWCTLCFERFPQSMLNALPDGGVEDVCCQCAATEAACNSTKVCYWVCAGRIPEQADEAYAFGPYTEQECREQFIERIWRDETAEYRAEVEESYGYSAIISHVIASATPMQVTQIE